MPGGTKKDCAVAARNYFVFEKVEAFFHLLFSKIYSEKGPQIKFGHASLTATSASISGFLHLNEKVKLNFFQRCKRKVRRLCRTVNPHDNLQI